VPTRRLSDGSFLAKLYPSPRHRDRDEEGIVVRIIEYTFDDPGRPGSGEKHRLLTTLLDARRHPATRLIVIYHERWEEELAFDELKTHQRERPVLRSETPAGVGAGNLWFAFGALRDPEADVRSGDGGLL